MPKGAMRAVGSGDVSGLPEWAHKHDSGDGADGGHSAKKEEVAKDTGDLPSLQKRMSVRDLASKFEKGQAAAHAAASKVATHTGKGKGANVADTDNQFKKLRSVLNDLLGRVAGRNKDDVEEALTATEALSVIFTQRETELEEERGEVKKLAQLFKQASDDAKKMVDEARTGAQAAIEAANANAAKAQAAIEAANASAANVQNDFQEEERMLTTAEKNELEELRKEIHEARRIKMLHESSRAMDMQLIIDGLRQQLAEKASESVKLGKELEAFKQQERGKIQWYQLIGHELLGSTLTVSPVDEKVFELSPCSVQWYRVSADGNVTDPIAGAIRSQYAPEPFDIGKFLRAEIYLPTGKTESLQTGRPIDTAPGLENYVEVLVGKGAARFNVRIVLKNGDVLECQPLHTLDVNKTRIKLCEGRTVKAREIYSSSMQLCGARGGGDSAAQGLFWVAKKGLTFMLVLESERERNAAILLARRFAKLNQFHLGGPDDVALGS